MGKLGTYISNQIKTTRNTFRDPIIATVSVGMILALFVFVVWPLLMVVKQSFTDLDGNFRTWTATSACRPTSTS